MQDQVRLQLEQEMSSKMRGSHGNLQPKNSEHAIREHKYLLAGVKDGGDAVFLGSAQSDPEASVKAATGEYLWVYMTPEKLFAGGIEIMSQLNRSGWKHRTVLQLQQLQKEREFAPHAHQHEKGFDPHEHLLLHRNKRC